MRYSHNLYLWAFSLIIGSSVLFIDLEDGSKAWVTCQVTTVGIPLIIMGYCYYHIYRAAKRQFCHLNANTVHTESNAAQLQKLAKNRKASVTVAIVIGLFVVLFCPNFVFSIIEISTTEHCQNLKVYRDWLWAVWLGFASSVFNPWVYAIRSREFRKAYRKICLPIYKLMQSAAPQLLAN